MASPPNIRVGHGYDIHRLQPGGRLMLCGILVSEALSPIAHSDGDVALHALVDALLGALALGDIGELFPDSDPQWKNAPSEVFVAEAVRRLHAAGWRVGNVDLTLLAEKPRLKPFKPQMASRVSQMLHIPLGCVNIKAGTHEGVDAVGREEAIAAHAVALVVKD